MAVKVIMFVTFTNVKLLKPKCKVLKSIKAVKTSLSKSVSK